MQEWYLMTSPTLTSGNERDLIGEYGNDAVFEMLESIGEQIELYNYDLSERTECKALVIGKAQDTKLKAMVRRLIVPIGTCHAGMYVKYNNKFWIIVGVVDTNMIYDKVVMTLCNYKLTWIGTDGKVVQRWASIESASQYNNGETGMQYYRVRSDQLLVVLPDDRQSLLLDTGMRFVIDRRTEIYEQEIGEDVEVDTSYNLFIYEVTRSDTVLFNYQDSGHSEFLASQDEQKPTDGYYRIDGNGYWLASYERYQSNTETNHCNIKGINDTVIIDVEPATFIGQALDENGEVDNSVELNEANWTVECDYMDELEIEYINNSIAISTSSKKLANKIIILRLTIEGCGTAEREVPVSYLY